MKLKNLDKNFACEEEQSAAIWHQTEEVGFALYGIQKDDSGYCRISSKDASAFSAELQFLCRHTSGGLLAFQTESSFVTLKATVPAVENMPHMTLLGSSGFDLYLNENGKFVYYKSFIPCFENNVSTCQITFETAEMHKILIYFPLYQSVTNVEIGLEACAPPLAFAPYCNAPIVFYGSSITQGGCASRPGNAYPAIISRMLCAGFLNLGFSGNAKGEIEMAAYIASLKMSVLVLDYDHNAPSATYLAQTLAPFYKCIRKAQPTVPIVFVSRPDYNATRLQDKERRKVIREFCERVKKSDDNVSFVDGAHLFDPRFHGECTVDGCHPNDFGFVCMAKKIGRHLKSVLACNADLGG